MTTDARRAIIVVRECIDADRYALTIHFSKRMEERGLFWPDVQAVIDEPKDVALLGIDQYGRSKLTIRGAAAFGGDIQIVCAIEIDETNAEFITLYWED